MHGKLSATVATDPLFPLRVPCSHICRAVCKATFVILAGFTCSQTVYSLTAFIWFIKWMHCNTSPEPSGHMFVNRGSGYLFWWELKLKMTAVSHLPTGETQLSLGPPTPSPSRPRASGLLGSYWERLRNHSSAGPSGFFVVSGHSGAEAHRGQEPS